MAYLQKEKTEILNVNHWWRRQCGCEVWRLQVSTGYVKYKAARIPR